jgi:hypothetical protein
VEGKLALRRSAYGLNRICMCAAKGIMMWRTGVARLELGPLFDMSCLNTVHEAR